MLKATDMIVAEANVRKGLSTGPTLTNRLLTRIKDAIEIERRNRRVIHEVQIQIGNGQWNLHRIDRIAKGKDQPR